VVLALPRGGVPVAAPVAEALGAPLGLLMVKKIGMPGHAEFAIGAVVDGSSPHVVRNPESFGVAGLDDDAFQEMVRQKVAEIERRKKDYGTEDVPVAGRTVIIVDDGVATGASARAAIEALIAQKPASVILAVPVAPPSTVRQLSRLADEVVCLRQPEPFFAVGAHYVDFRQVSDETVRNTMRAFQGTT
jgi:predicted phosphoribosyltransferase